MASCIKDNENGGQMSRKKKQQRARKNTGFCNNSFKQSPIGKRAAKKKRRKMNINLLNVSNQVNNCFKVRKVEKKRTRNDHGVFDVFNKRVHNSNKKKIVDAENVTSSNESVIVCDSDTEAEPINDIIEIHDSMSEIMEEKSVNNMGEEDVIVLDDTTNEEVRTPCKRTRFENKGDESGQVSNATATPNSIVVVFSNSPPKPRNTIEAEVINIEDSVVEEGADSTTKSDTNAFKHLESLRSHSIIKNNQPTRPQDCNFIPLTISNPKRTINRAVNHSQRNKPSGSLQSIKVTVCGNDRSFQSIKPNRPSATVTSENTHTSHSSSAVTSSVPSQSTGNLLPISTVGSAFGGNLYNAGHTKREGLREIIIDGSNVAMGHSLGKFFSVKGLKICIDYFIQRGHKVRAFVPHFRIKYGQSSEPALLRQLHDKGLVVLTPSRVISGKKITCYDDRLLVQCAAELGAVVVSGDNYRDLLRENPSLRETIEKRLLIPTWVDDIIMFPSDPLGRFGPSLDQFLRFS